MARRYKCTTTVIGLELDAQRVASLGLSAEELAVGEARLAKLAERVAKHWNRRLNDGGPEPTIVSPA